MEKSCQHTISQDREGTAPAAKYQVGLLVSRTLHIPFTIKNQIHETIIFSNKDSPFYRNIA